MCVCVCVFPLRECLHDSVTHSEHVQVQCPFNDGDYQCEEFIADREIRTVSDQYYMGTVSVVLYVILCIIIM